MMIPMPPCFNVGDTIYFSFDSYDSNMASVTITGLAVTDIEIYKDGSTTQRASDNGYAILGVDFDGIVGFHGFSVDTSDNSDAGFWVDGAQFFVVVDAITVDGQTVRFSYFLPLGYSLRPTTAGRTLDVESGGCAGIDWANVANPTTAVDLSATDIQLCDTTTTNTDMVGTAGANTTVPDAAGTAAGLHATTDAAIAALENLSSAEAEAACDAAFATYDPPTNAEMLDRTLGFGSYATAAGQTSLSLAIAAVPTTGEFEAFITTRSLLAADYFDASADEVTVTSASRTAISDDVLARDVSNAEPSGEEHTLRFGILQITESNTDANPGKLTVYQTDGVTEVCQKTVATDATAHPVTGIS